MDSGDDGVPVAPFRLTEEAHGRVPGCIIAIREPSPVGRVREQGPDRFSEGSGEVRDRGIHGDDQVEIQYGGRSLGEVVEIIGKRDKWQGRGGASGFF